MSSIDPFADLFQLSRLHLDAGPRRRLQSRLEKVLDYLRQLEDADVDDAPLPSAEGALLREDELAGSLLPVQLLTAATDHDGEYFLSPAVLDGRSEEVSG